MDENKTLKKLGIGVDLQLFDVEFECSLYPILIEFDNKIWFTLRE